MSDAIRVARYLASKEYPYLSTALFSMQMIQIDDSFSTMGVDKNWRCYYSEKTVEEWGTNVTKTVLIHEVWHLLRKHHERMGIRDKDAWNRAADREINDDLRNLKFPFEPCLPEQIQMKSGLLAEDYYKEDENYTYYSNFGGSSADGIAREWEEKDNSGDNAGITKSEAERIIRETANQIKDYAGKNRGYTPYNARCWAEFVLTPPKVDYKKELRSRLASIIKRGYDDITYSKISRSRRSPNLIFPGSYSREPNIAVIIDTSGSMNAEGNKVLSEVNGILKSFDHVNIISADAVVHNIQKVRNIKDVCAIGGGGTSMKAAIEQVDKMKPDVILTITDGYTDWNSKPTRAKQITLLTENVKIKPPFGKIIIV